MGVDVVVVGACNTDLTAYVPRLPVVGETLHGTKFQIGFGGKGANQCVMAGKLGCSVAMISKLGDDSFGRDTRENFRAQGVSCDHLLTTSEAATGVAPIAVDSEGNNSIIIVGGANDLLTPAEIDAAEETIAGAKVLVCQLEIKTETSLRALEVAKKHGTKTIFNPAPALKGLDKRFLELADIVCPNETEAELLTGIKVDSDESAVAAAKKLWDLGASDVIITLGGRGVLLAQKAGGKTEFVGCDKVKVVDSSGAGDSFVGSLAFYLATMPELSLAAAVRRSSKIATVSVQGLGTQSSYPRRADLPAALFAAE